MDKFMIDPKEPVIKEEPIINEEEPMIPEEKNEPMIKEDEPIINEEEPMINQEEPMINQEEPMINQEPMIQGRSYIIIIIGLFIFVGYSIYYSFKYKENEKNYLIKSNAYTFKDTLDGMKKDIKSYLKNKAEQYADWKEYLTLGINKYFFNKHVDNGVFKATKYKATNLLKKM